MVDEMGNKPTKINWQSDPNLDSEGAANSTTIKIKSNVFNETNSLILTMYEELIHVFQTNYNPTAYSIPSDGTGIPNIEFEAKFLMDLTNDIASKYNNESIYFGIDLGMGQNFDDEYYDWMYDITNGFTSSPKSFSEFQNRYFYFVEKFKNYHKGTDYDKPINYNLMPLSLLYLTQNSSCNY